MSSRQLAPHEHPVAQPRVRELARDAGLAMVSSLALALGLAGLLVLLAAIVPGLGA